MTQIYKHDSTRPSVYLFGPLIGQTFKQTIYWRKFAELYFAEIGIETFSPVRGLEVENPNAPFKSEYKHDIMHQSKAFTTRDLHDILQTNGMLGSFGSAKIGSLGSAIEIGFAYAHNRPIVTVIPQWSEIREGDKITPIDNVHDHPMIREMSLVVPSLEDGLRAMTHFLLPARSLRAIDFANLYFQTEKVITQQEESFWKTA